MAVKRFVDEKQHSNGLQAFLFRDSAEGCLQILWNDTLKSDVKISFPAETPVTMIRLDGRREVISSQNGFLTVPVSVEPTMLLYQSQTDKLPTMTTP